MKYHLAEPPFWSVQGEGLRTGEPTIFIRLAGCNVTEEFWCYEWCDTKFARTTEGAQGYSTLDILAAVLRLPPVSWVCITGGEPLIHNLHHLLSVLRGTGYKIQVETNGTLIPKFHVAHVDHWTVSPKTPVVAGIFLFADELKYVITEKADLERVTRAEPHGCTVYLQPNNNDQGAIALILEALETHPTWRLGLQVHKVIGVK